MRSAAPVARNLRVSLESTSLSPLLREFDASSLVREGRVGIADEGPLDTYVEDLELPIDDVTFLRQDDVLAVEEGPYLLLRGADDPHQPEGDVGGDRLRRRRGRRRLDRL